MRQTAACRNALREARDAAGERAEKLREVEGGGFSFHVRANGEDDLTAFLRADASEQWLDAEVLGQDAIEGGDFAA